MKVASLVDESCGLSSLSSSKNYSLKLIYYTQMWIIHCLLPVKRRLTTMQLFPLDHLSILHTPVKYSAQRCHNGVHVHRHAVNSIVQIV